MLFLLVRILKNITASGCILKNPTSMIIVFIPDFCNVLPKFFVHFKLKYNLDLKLFLRSFLRRFSPNKSQVKSASSILFYYIKICIFLPNFVRNLIQPFVIFPYKCFKMGTTGGVL
jgi:hypothetical protein